MCRKELHVIIRHTIAHTINLHVALEDASVGLYQVLVKHYMNHSRVTYINRHQLVVDRSNAISIIVTYIGISQCFFDWIGQLIYSGEAFSQWLLHRHPVVDCSNAISIIVELHT